MLIMLHYDSVHNPTPAQMGIPPGSKKSQPTQKGVLNQAQHLAYLESHPYIHYEEEELTSVSKRKKKQKKHPPVIEKVKL